MRCVSCNKVLSSFESTRKSVATGQYLDLCNGCFKHVADQIPVLESSDDFDDAVDEFDDPRSDYNMGDSYHDDADS